MRKLFMLGLSVAMLSAAWLVKPVFAQAAPPESGETFSGQLLCQPDAYLVEPADCLPLGPSLFLTEMAKKGITFPLQPLPAVPIDPELAKLPLNFAKINVDQYEDVPLYSSLDDAVAGTNAVGKINAGPLRFISYVQRADINGGHFLMLKSGQWVRASPAALSYFGGLVFSRTPRNNFGWIVDDAKPRSAPGYAYPETGKTYLREAVVQVFDRVEMDNTTWYMIGLSEWVERRYIRIVDVNTQAPSGVDNNRWIDVNLYEQTLAVYEDGVLKYATLIATGMEPFYTQPGVFKIYEKKDTETMTGAFENDKSDYYYLEDVPWTMYFDEARALHGAYWRTWFGYPQSHGCVNLSLGDSRWLYDWAKVGDWVYVHDPSGETPTDPAYYGQGGA